MAMVKCPKCGKDVSDKATKCVYCGLMLKSNNKARMEKAPQELYDEACKYYKDLQLTVRKIGLMLESVEDIDFSTTNALYQMDYALQYILLLQAVSDGEVDHFEQQFVDMITEHGDLLCIINDHYDTNLSWETLELFNNKSICTMLTGIIDDMSYIVLDFVTEMAMVDAIITDYDYYADIRKDFLNIAECLACIDNDASDNIGAEYFDSLIGNFYLEKKREFEAQHNGKE